MLVLSIFPGIDMLGTAFSQAGFCVVRGGDPIFGGDVRTEHYPPGVFAGVIGGPPCQSFSSLAHLVRANGHEPKFGNLIPEFERVVTEALPAWFVMENVRAAPLPVVSGYGVKSFLLDNAMLDSGDGHGQEQTRLRRFSFGMRGRADADVPDLRRWIDLATFLLPDAADDSRDTVSGSGGVNWKMNETELRRTSTRTVTAMGPDHLQGLRDSTNETRRTRRQAVVSDPNTVPVKIGGSEKVKRTRKAGITGSGGGISVQGLPEPEYLRRRKAAAGGKVDRTNHEAVNGSHGVPPSARDKGKGRYRFEDACRLQGLSAEWCAAFVEHSQMTAEGRLKAVANGVPIFMGVAIAQAVKEAINANL
jgi:site-specific DNA-cytosine methylase